MKGLELSKRYYEEFGKPMLNEQFADVLPFLAAGLCGSGSECYGFDDDVSQDHDFEPGFCIFLPNENIVDPKTAFALERAYSKLPKEFEGYKRNSLSAVGGNRHGVIRTGDFFEAKTGSRKGNLSISQWFTLPEHALSEAVNGEVFFDNYGEISKIRETLSRYPEDIRLKKLAGNLLLMGQSGQYNYGRCVIRGETAAAQLALFEFVKSTMNAVFLLNNKYIPYYKWSFRALRELYPDAAKLAASLEFLLSSDNTALSAKKKAETVESICITVSEELIKHGLLSARFTEAERLAYIVNDKIKDNQIRNMHILCGV